MRSSEWVLFQIEASQLDDRLNFPLGHFPVRSYLFILVQIQIIWCLVSIVNLRITLISNVYFYLTLVCGFNIGMVIPTSNHKAKISVKDKTAPNLHINKFADF